jgi:hypothetical protein
LALALADLAVTSLDAQQKASTLPIPPPSPASPPSGADGRATPNGDARANAVLRTDYEQNRKDARDLIALAKSIELDFDKNDQNVLSLRLLKKLDDVEKITKRIRARLR